MPHNRYANLTSESKQDYFTPWYFLKQVEKRFGKITHDLAAHSKNHRVESYFSLEKGQDSMHMTWPKNGVNWLNPPYSARPESPYSLRNWSAKCVEQNMEGAQNLFLVPAAVGANWFRDNVWGMADIYFLNGRIMFTGDQGIAVDLLLAHYNNDNSRTPSVWDWRNDLVYNF